MIKKEKRRNYFMIHFICKEINSASQLFKSSLEAKYLLQKLELHTTPKDHRNQCYDHSIVLLYLGIKQIFDHLYIGFLKRRELAARTGYLYQMVTQEQVRTVIRSVKVFVQIKSSHTSTFSFQNVFLHASAKWSYQLT